ncbi:hypothetical protein GPECTOR_138g654 [Gonium pectorale]|uniref:Uncharacterized protein n=1 Tax=Gonium pectorale TaxID=33097 RepID=A0A150FY25_GONPE|nr:hypothetical protein GPECTOR_138g654 [Gonium pectorale]|eukprot:KXZ42523.1 hypothetical protein GPECTOR_138g654 [Gonium pectorale]
MQLAKTAAEILDIVDIVESQLVHSERKRVLDTLVEVLEEPYTEAKLLVQELGGLQAVLKDKVKLEQVCSKLGVAEQLLINLVGGWVGAIK